MPSPASRPYHMLAALALAAVPVFAGQLAGTVRDASGQPLAGALVVGTSITELKDEDGKTRRWIATSNAEGRFAFDGFPAGPCHVTANAGDTGIGHELGACTGPGVETTSEAVIDVHPVATRIGGHLRRATAAATTSDDLVLAIRIPNGDPGPDMIYATHVDGDIWSLTLPTGAWMAKAITPSASSGSTQFVLPGRTRPIDFDLAPHPGSHPEIAHEFKAMVGQDQAARHGLEIHGVTDKPTLALVERTDRANLKRMEQIIQHHGWPTATLVGRAGMGDFWLLTQHAPQSFIARALPHLKAAADRDEIGWPALALTIDRDLVNRHQPQVYGTQVAIGSDGSMTLDPVLDETHLDARRAQVGLGPVADYLALLRHMYATPR